MKIRSEFVKSELKKTKWKDRKYIDDLIQIEKAVISKHVGHFWVHIKNRYLQQWKAILLELNPGEYQEILENEEKEILEAETAEKLQIKTEKKNWKKRGGLP